MKLIECMMRQSSCYKGTTKGVPVGVLWHDTGAGNPNVKRYVQPDDDAPDREALTEILGTNQYKNDWNHAPRQAGVNAFIGELADGTVGVVQVLPLDYRPWGCGSGKHGSCNGRADKADSPFWIQFEICDDKYKSKDYFEQAYKAAVEWTAYLCEKFGFDPNGTVIYNGVSVPTIICHAEAAALGLASNHGDVIVWFDKYGKTMANVRNDVAKIIDGHKKPVLDNTPANWSKNAVEWAVDNGILAGDENGNLMLREYPTREQLVTILYKFKQVFDV